MSFNLNKVLSVFIFLSALNISLFAGISNDYPTNSLIQSGIKIIDIRTEGEWRTTGIVKDSIPITFFDERGNYNISEFMAELTKNISKNEKFALICRTGSRSKVVASFLGRNGFDVVNLAGGIMYAIKKEGIKTVPYTSK